MQILGKGSRILFVAIAIAMLTALGLSFALWDTTAVKASNGDSSKYANAKVGDVITFGQYYQTGNKDKNDPTEYEKTPIEWLVVDKDERSGQLTLLSRYILASGSFFGNCYYNAENAFAAHYDYNATVDSIPYNQAYADSTVRAYLNNLERMDMGGDGFTSGIGYVPSKFNSASSTGLYTSVGFSNKKYWTGLNYENEADKNLVLAGNKGLHKRQENGEIYFQRPINNDEYKARPAARGFYNEAFNDTEKSIIIPKTIAGTISHRWPDKGHDIKTNSYTEGTYDKVWIPSATELNSKSGVDWTGNPDNSWTIPSDEAGSTAFEYFENFSAHGFKSLNKAIKATRTKFATNSFAANFSIPMYNRLEANSTEITVNTDINEISNSIDHYWTRTPSAHWFDCARMIHYTGNVSNGNTNRAQFGVRPGIIIKY